MPLSVCAELIFTPCSVRPWLTERRDTHCENRTWATNQLCPPNAQSNYWIGWMSPGPSIHRTLNAALSHTMGVQIEVFGKLLIKLPRIPRWLIKSSHHDARADGLDCGSAWPHVPKIHVRVVVLVYVIRVSHLTAASWLHVLKWFIGNEEKIQK